MKQKNLILMVVAVGCGLVAAFLTSQMSSKPIEQVDVIVAGQDLPVGTMLTKDAVAKLITRTKMPKDAAPIGVVETEDELVDQRLTRAFTKGEPIKKGDLSKGGVVQIPPGMHMVSIPMGVPQAVAGFVGPGSHVDVLGTVRLDNKITALPILMNMLVLAVDANTQYPKDSGGVFAALSTVSLAVDRKQALLIKLAQARGCDMSLLLRRPEEKALNDESYNIDEVIKLLQDEKNPAKVVGSQSPESRPQPEPRTDETPKVAMVKVPVAAVDLPAGTELTKELISDATKFRTGEYPKELAGEAYTDLTPYLGKALKTGLSKGQWVTASLIGDPQPKPSPVDPFTTPKPAPVDPVPVVPPVKRRTHDVAIHTATGTKVFRYEEVKPGEWKAVGEVQQPKPVQPERPDVAPQPPEKKVD